MSVCIIVGSKNDISKVKDCFKTLKEFNVSFVFKVLSAHRTPDELEKFIKEIEKNVDVFIAAAGMSAHLAGVIASKTSKPVIAIPLDVKLGGIDSLLSMVNMPPGIPVACVGIDSAKNAAILALEIIAIKDERIRSKLIEMRKKLISEILETNKEIEKLGIDEFIK
jgi:5-(carboxyamino)imidazole ribonucleotide mutase